MNTYMSTAGNTAKQRATHTAAYKQHKKVRPWLGANLQCICQYTKLSHKPFMPDSSLTHYACNTG